MKRILSVMAPAVVGALMLIPRAGEAGDLRGCREYQDTANIGGRAQSVYGLACKENDGTWRMHNGLPARPQGNKAVFGGLADGAADLPDLSRRETRIYDETYAGRAPRHPYYRDAGVTITAPLDIVIGSPPVREEVHYYEVVQPRPVVRTRRVITEYYDDDDVVEERYVRRYVRERGGRGHCHRGRGHGYGRWHGHD